MFFSRYAGKKLQELLYFQKSRSLKTAPGWEVFPFLPALARAAAPAGCQRALEEDVKARARGSMSHSAVVSLTERLLLEPGWKKKTGGNNCLPCAASGLSGGPELVTPHGSRRQLAL